MKNSFSDFRCKHFPKKYKKMGKIFGESCKIPVCQNCKNHPDLQNFKEEVIQN